ncbi:phasin family protein [Paraburkholderia azotifigens]|uniref:Phasin family protein n=1 Tax=Paraburkholderia azotifigens TaxID=2057004 RepID=A0A5C6VK86_9BURK|nr:phasin family protein [Paraburkholderia azotifigens]TXC85500.1 phasin family protein [Paraburkholderia azotifigens]
MNTTAVEQSADFGLRTLPVFFGLQNEGFERLQKLTHLNLAALKAMLDEGKAVLLSLPSGLPSSTGAVGLSQQFFERALAYAEHVRQIDSQFMAAVTQAGEDLQNRYNAIGKQLAANLGQTTPFGADAAYAAMQSAIGGMMRSQGMMQETVQHAAGMCTPGNAAVPDIA